MYLSECICLSPPLSLPFSLRSSENVSSDEDKKDLKENAQTCPSYDIHQMHQSQGCHYGKKAEPEIHKMLQDVISAIT